MGIPRKMLASDEVVLRHWRPHLQVLGWPLVVLLLLAAGVGGGMALVPESHRPGGQLAIAVLGGVLALWWCGVPFLRWRTTETTITSRRLISRRGILTKVGTDLPLLRVNDVAHSRTLLDRVLGCGTLHIQTAAESGPVVLEEVPEVQDVHRLLAELIFGTIPERSAGPVAARRG